MALRTKRFSKTASARLVSTAPNDGLPPPQSTLPQPYSATYATQQQPQPFPTQPIYERDGSVMNTQQQFGQSVAMESDAIQPVDQLLDGIDADLVVGLFNDNERTSEFIGGESTTGTIGTSVSVLLFSIDIQEPLPQPPYVGFVLSKDNAAVIEQRIREAQEFLATIKVEESQLPQTKGLGLSYNARPNNNSVSTGHESTKVRDKQKQDTDDAEGRCYELVDCKANILKPLKGFIEKPSHRYRGRTGK